VLGLGVWFTLLTWNRQGLCVGVSEKQQIDY